MSTALSDATKTVENNSNRNSSTSWQDRFLTMLPGIRRQARFALIHLPAEARDDALHEAVANALVAFRRLVDQRREHLASATSLARFAVAHIRAGRQTGCLLNANDVTSPYARRQRGIVVEHMGDWQEALVEDRRATPADIAATRIDFTAWLETLKPRWRAMAELLATGETSTGAAEVFGVSIARVSQFRRALQEAWDEFQGYPAGEQVLVGA